MSEHFEDEEKVRLKETGETVTIKEWSLTRMGNGIKRYTYTLKERASFYYHSELERI
ncbi:hypothetical protein [Paenibacillus sp. FSL L8-0708]|uniref:hypothetical protein n=1 Tax=Paenibacillus sp. FSL L8-0708 TaxID=2975311 RepID=UPI0030FA1F4D